MYPTNKPRYRSSDSQSARPSNRLILNTAIIIDELWHCRHDVGLHEEELQPLSAANKRSGVVSTSSAFLFPQGEYCEAQFWPIGCKYDVRLD